jgi:hypothetical protein
MGSIGAMQQAVPTVTLWESTAGNPLPIIGARGIEGRVPHRVYMVVSTVFQPVAWASMLATSSCATTTSDMQNSRSLGNHQRIRESLCP